MEGAGEQPRQALTPAGEAVRLEAHASDQARINQAARDLHVHYEEGVRDGRRAKSSTATEECPYPGLAAFGREQARWFFGREQLTAELIARLDGRLRTGGMQAVVAPSGAGKSSLLRAGLLPRLSSGALPRSSQWPTVAFTPTAQPLQALATQIGALTGADPVSMAEQFMADSQQAEAVPRGRIRGVDPGTRLVMVVDQFEELFTLCTDDRQRRTFIELLAQIADPRSAGTPSIGLVVIGIRADFCAACVNYSHLRTALQENPLVVGPMSDAELRAAILYPAQDMRLSIEPGLIELLLGELGNTAGDGGFVIYEAGRLPLLAHALQATWQQRNGRTLTVAGYRTTGGIHHAVATTAEQLFAGLDSTGQTVARTLFLRLIKIGDDTEDTRRRMARTDLLQGLPSGSTLAVLDAFTQGRLLTQEQDTVEITHEALLRVWPRLRQWIDTDRAGNLTRQELEEATAVWEHKGRDSAELYRGRRLEEAHAWATSSSHEGDPSPAVTAFLIASTHQEHRIAKRRRTVLIMLSVLILVASGAAVIAARQSAFAEQQRNTAIVNRIVANADQLRSTDVSLAAQLDLTAYRMRPKSPELYTKLLTTENAVLSTPLTSHTDAVLSVAFSSDKRTLASAGVDKTVRLWDVRDPAHPASLGQPLIGHSDWVRSVAFSPDGRTLASASSDQTVRLWNVTDPAHPAPLGQPLTGHDGSVHSVAFSPDGHTLASASDDHTVRLWDLADAAHPTSLGGPLTGHTKAVNSVVFSPDRHTLASASDDHTVRLWDLTDPAHPTELGQPFTAQRGTVASVAFSPDGHTLAGAGEDHTVRLWNLTDPAHPAPLGQPLTGHTNTIYSVTFSPDGRTLASASDDQTVRLWNLTNPAHPAPLSQPLAGHTNAVWSVMFSPDGRTLASASTDRTIRLWSIPDTVLTGHSEYVTSVAFSPDGRTLASASTDHTVRLWDLTNPARPRALGQPLPGYTTIVWSVAFSPDGRTLATGNGSGNIDYTVRLWNLTDPTHPRALGHPLIGHNDSVVSVAFSPDGHTLASASNDHTVRLWNLTDLTHPAQLGEPLTGHTRQVVSVAFSPDGRTLASAGLDRKGRLWNLTDPAHPAPLGQPLTGHTNAVLAVAFSPDRHTLASAGYDQTVRLWDVTDPAHPALLGQPLIGHTSVVTSVRFSPDGNTLASAGYGNDSTVRLWGMNEDQAIQRICGTTGNTLTQAKWEQYVSKDLTYAPPCPR